jgi:hypothetical protein
METSFNIHFENLASDVFVNVTFVMMLTPTFTRPYDT